MSKAPPSWTDENLAHHHDKRVRENPDCLEDLLGITGRTVTVEEYRDRSVRAVAEAWCEYVAQGRDFDRSAYLPARASYVDDELVVAVTDLARARFMTCFHEHFDGCQPPHGRNPGTGVSAAQRRLRYRSDLRLKAQGKPIINLEVDRDG